MELEDAESRVFRVRGWGVYGGFAEKWGDRQKAMIKDIEPLRSSLRRTADAGE